MRFILERTATQPVGKELESDFCPWWRYQATPATKCGPTSNQREDSVPFQLAGRQPRGD